MQSTISKTVSVTGVGLHSGQDIKLTLMPADVNAGIVFLRDGVSIPGRYDSVSDTKMCTLIEKDGVKIGTVEHLLAAVSAMSIDNLTIEVSDAEIPILDGSSEGFMTLLKEAGRTEQAVPRRMIKILKYVRVEEDDKYAELLPGEGFKLSFTAYFDHPAFEASNKTMQFDLSSADAFLQEISAARTFGFKHELDYLQSIGLAKGASLDNAIGLDESDVMNADGLRYPDEFIRHKILDAIGDLYLAGHHFIGHYHGHKSGHALNNQLLRKIFSEPSNFAIVEEPPVREG